MKTNSIIALILSISLFGLFGCADKYEVDYDIGTFKPYLYLRHG